MGEGGTENVGSKELLASIATGKVSATDVLTELAEEQLTEMLFPTFVRTGDEPLVGKGEGILPGDVSGQLVIDRELGERLLEEAEARCTEIDLVYSPPSGGLEDFRVLRASEGFFTNEGETTFCAVQASNEGVPAIVDLNCLHEEQPEPKTLTYEFRDGSSLEIEQPTRMVKVSHDGYETEISEAEFVSMSGAKGKIFRGRAASSHSTNVMRAHRLLARCYLESLDRFGPREAEMRLADTNAFDENRGWLLNAVDSEEFQGFKTLARTARGVADLKVFSTAHTSEAMALTRMFGSEVSLGEDREIRVEADESDYGLGLLRDERTWSEPEDIDLLRLILLGPETVGDRYKRFEECYLDNFSRKVYRVLRVGAGEVATVRLLCMPMSMIFTEDFDAEAFAAEYELDPEEVRGHVEVLASENEAYHGCRGVRLTVQREDICQLWCEGVIRGAKQAGDEGVPVKLQILLAMVTFPQEVEHFVRVFECKAQELLGDDWLLGNERGWIRGISAMIETSGAFHLVEEILDVKGDRFEVNGALFGGNDFTAACLNMNRADADALILPAYIRLGILPDSPFDTLNQQIVGKALGSALRRARVLERKNSRRYLLGLGGEIAGDWDSVQWLTRNAAPYGLDYVSTPPDRLLHALFASAQASLHGLYGSVALAVRS